MTVLEQAYKIREAMDIAGSYLNEEMALECVHLYRAWEIGKEYVIDEYLTYGLNDVGDPQLYKVAQAHTSQEDWTPDITPALYVAIGLNEEGYPIWSQPTGAHDAYNTGDIVDYNGTLYISLIDGNIWAPDAYPAGWKIYNLE